MIAPLAGQAQPEAERATVCTGVVAGVTATGADGWVRLWAGGACTVVGLVTAGVLTAGLVATTGALLAPPRPKRITCPTRIMYGGAMLLWAARAFQSQP